MLHYHEAPIQTKASAISLQKHSLETQAKADDTNKAKAGNPGSASDGDILSPSQQLDKTKTTCSEDNLKPLQLKQGHIGVEDEDGGAGGRTLSQDDVIPPSGRQVERARNKDTDHPQQSRHEDQSVKKGQNIKEAAGEDSDEEIIPPSRKVDDKTMTRNKDVNDHKSEVSLARNSLSEPKAMVTKKELSGGTFTNDVVPLSGNDDGGRRTGKRQREDLVTMDTEDPGQKMDVTEESNGRKESKRSRPAEEVQLKFKTKKGWFFFLS